MFLQSIYLWWKDNECEGNCQSPTNQDVTACVSLIFTFFAYYFLLVTVSELLYWRICVQVRAYNAFPSQFPFFYCQNLDYWRFLTDVTKSFKVPVFYWICHILILNLLSFATHVFIAALLSAIENDELFGNYLILTFVNLVVSGLRFFHGTILCYFTLRNRYRPRMQLQEVEDRDEMEVSDVRVQLKQFVP